MKQFTEIDKQISLSSALVWMDRKMNKTYLIELTP